MRTSSKILLIVAVLAVGALVALSLRRPPLGPAQQIANQMDSAVEAANQHNAGGVMEIVSADYHDDNGYNVDLIHAMLVRGLRNTPGLHASLSTPQITVDGGQATSTALLTVVDQQSGHTLYSQEITLQWRREHARSFLVFPTDVWLVVSASYGSPGGDMEIGI